MAVLLVGEDVDVVGLVVRDATAADAGGGFGAGVAEEGADCGGGASRGAG